jgi:hypothetical protein
MTPGFTTSSKTRPLLISKLDIYLREKVSIIRSKRLIEELRVFIWHGSKAEAQRGYNDDLVMAFSIGMWVRDTALKLRQQGIELDKLAISKIGKSNDGGIYTNNYPGQNPWKMKTGKGEDEDLSWLIK